MDKQGQRLNTEREQQAGWAEHFNEVLNRPPTPTTEGDTQDSEEDLDVNSATPEKNEIKAAIKYLKNRKAPGKANLDAEPNFFLTFLFKLSHTKSMCCF